MGKPNKNCTKPYSTAKRLWENANYFKIYKQLYQQVSTFSMHIKFYKYQGAGNDFVMLDNRNGNYNNLSQAEIAQLCDRRFGVGADGLIKLEPSDGADFAMRYYNADGGEAEMCGNGTRCIVSLAKSLQIIDGKTSFMAQDGIHHACITEDGVSVQMGNVQEVEIGEDYFYLNTGVPHYVKFVKNVTDFDVVKNGRAIRNSERFKEVGTNVNFVQLADNRCIIRTYERGVEDETLACGTGCTASAIAAYLLEKKYQDFSLKALGGTLRIWFKTSDDQHFEEVWMEGPAEKVFEGELDL